MDEKQETKSAYDKYAKEYEKHLTNEYFDKYLIKYLKSFLNALNGKKVLNIGCGTGRESLFLKHNEINTINIDISSSMVKICMKKGLDAYEMDMENMSFEPNSFNGVWAYTSLLHIPKNRIRNVLIKISELLTKNGIFFIGMKKGNFEGLKEMSYDSSAKRFFALYTKEELLPILEEFFEILKFDRAVADEKHIYLNFLCKKK